MKATAVWRGGFRSELGNGRGHAVVADWPVEDGGENAGPGPLELALMSLAGCVVTIFAAVAKKHRLAFEGMTVELEADRPKGAPTIERVRGRVAVKAKAPKAQVETAFRLTKDQCPVGVLFEKAGVTIDWTLVVEP